MKKEEITETLEQIIEQLRFYQSLGIQTVELRSQLGDPSELARLLAQYITMPDEALEPAVASSLAPALSTRVLETAGDSPVAPSAPPAPGVNAVSNTETIPQAEGEPETPPAEAGPPPKKTRSSLLFDWETEASQVKPPSIFDALPKHDTLEIIRQDLGDCRRCKLCKTRNTIVFGCGSPSAELMLIGEGPGADEDAQGLPFVGRAGQLLTKILEAIHLTREEVYITNVVKCRPPQNRKPEPDEVDPCAPFLLRQINAIKPKLICALGGTAAQALLKTKEGITSMRGRVFDFHGYKLMPTFHPAYLLRNPGDKRLVWEDMQKVRDYLQGKIAL